MASDATKKILDHMLHPVRMRVLMALAGSQGMTPLEIAGKLSDVPQATLYRHINRLARAELLQVVDERPVRGTVEKVYALNRSKQTHLGNEDMAQLTRDDHLRYFTAFMIAQLDQFSRYLNHQPVVDMAADGVGYTQVALYMSDAELAAFAQAINAVIIPYLEPTAARGDGVDRKKRFLTTILMPEVSGE